MTGLLPRVVAIVKVDDTKDPHSHIADALGEVAVLDQFPNLVRERGQRDFLAIGLAAGICPSVLFLMMTTLIGSLYFTAVTKSSINIENPPSPTKATHCRFG
jgi:hypothetical protein